VVSIKQWSSPTSDFPVFLSKYLVVNKKWLPILLILLMGAAILVIKLVKGNTAPSSKKGTTSTNDPSGKKTNRDNGFDRRISYLQYSNHAKCRMQCRNISQAEVEEIMQDGKINYNKSDLKSVKLSGNNCPRYAVEGITKDNQRVRIVYAQCDQSTTVVTVIDLETEFQCSCPGDDDKYKNRN
jgi:hypothetical protein